MKRGGQRTHTEVAKCKKPSSPSHLGGRPYAGFSEDVRLTVFTWLACTTQLSANPVQVHHRRHLYLLSEDWIAYTDRSASNGAGLPMRGTFHCVDKNAIMTNKCKACASVEYLRNAHIDRFDS